MGAFLPINVFLAVVFLFGVVWGWEGELLRRMFGVFSAIFMFPLWTAPLYSIASDTACCTIVTTSGWLPTILLANLLWWNIILAYFTVAHVFELLDRDPIGRKR
jgi:hypothetical protein